MGIAEKLADEAVARQIDLSRFDASIRGRVIGLLEDLEREIIATLADATDLTTWRRDRLQRQLSDIRAVIDGYYGRISTLSAVEMQGLAAAEAQWQVDVTNKALGWDLMSAMPSETQLARLADATLIQGAVQGDWWKRQSADTQFRFMTEMRMGVGQGQTNAQLVARVRGLLGTSKRNAEAVVRTSVQTVAGRARQDTLRANDDVVRGQQQVSTLDSRTSDICMAYSGAVWDLDDEPIDGTTLPFNGGPPRHWNCRSTLVPVLKSFRELGADFEDMPARTRASMDGQVAGDLSFADWLESKPPEFADEMLGKGRADLWRRGVITLPQLLDQSGRPLPLEQLRTRHRAR